MNPETGQPLKQDFVRNLISPYDAYRPLGAADELSSYLYGPMLEAGTVDRMIAFIDAVEPLMDKTLFMDEINEEYLQRTMLLLADMPNELAAIERLRAWEYFLDQNWLYATMGMYTDQHLEAAIDSSKESDQIRQRLLAILARKQHEIWLLDQDNLLANMSASSFDFDKAMKAQAEFEKVYPEARDLGDAVMRLSMQARSYK
jgi:hypothetical protein